LAEARNVQAAILAAVPNSLQLKILQRGGALGDAQIGWPSRLPCDLIVAMLKKR
jgi:hypothetical protein